MASYNFASLYADVAVARFVLTIIALGQPLDKVPVGNWGLHHALPIKLL